MTKMVSIVQTSSNQSKPVTNRSETGHKWIQEDIAYNIKLTSRFKTNPSKVILGHLIHDPGH